MPLPIRLALKGDLPHLPVIERAAAQHFAALGMHAVATGSTVPLPALEEHRAADLAWVATDGVPVAFLLASRLPHSLHVAELSVHPAYAHQGVGAALIERAACLARSEGIPALTLTTFEDVPWNAPYYARLGFEVLPEAEWTPELARFRATEGSLGLDAWPRLCMRREL